jgi:hypothetical protein
MMNSYSKKSSFAYVAHFVCGAMLAAILSGCGGGGGSPGGQTAGALGSGTTTTTTLVPTATLSLIMSSPELPSSGASGTEVQLTALVKSATNNVIAGQPVTFSATSGAIVAPTVVSDANGQVKATLTTGGDHSLRSITVTATSGAQIATGVINVTGTSIGISGPSSIIVGSSADITVTVKDSSGTAIANVPVTYSSSLGNQLAVKSSGGGTATQPTTNSKGQVVLTVTGTRAGSDTISLTSQGVSSGTTISVASTTLTVAAYSGGAAITQANINTCTQVNVALVGGSGGAVNLNTSRGTLYSDATCSTALTQSLTLDGAGNATAYTKSLSTGTTTLTATVVGGPSAQSQLSFVAPMTASGTIVLQANPSVIGPNTAGSTNQQSTITAIVRDGASGTSNLVQGASVQFTILQDPSGGFLQSPSVAVTDSGGAASVSFIAGPATTAASGVIIQAQIIGAGFVVTKTVALTVAKQALFITAGTGIDVGTPTVTTYSKDYAVFVTDSAGNPVPGATVTASVWPTKYRKGYLTWVPFDGLWEFLNSNAPYISYYPFNPATWPLFECPNEDVDKTGIFSAAKDTNGNGILDPGTPVNVTSSGVTNSSGFATVTLTYPRDRALWTVVQLTITGSVAGSEAVYTTVPFQLLGLAKDYQSQGVSPPGAISPYGTNVCSTAN